MGAADRWTRLVPEHGGRCTCRYLLSWNPSGVVDLTAGPGAPSAAACAEG